MVDLLKAFDSLATSNGINYFISGGSLLGAHRCSSILPWDDDLDFTMSESDAQKIIKITEGWVSLLTLRKGVGYSYNNPETYKV